MIVVLIMVMTIIMIMVLMIMMIAAEQPVHVDVDRTLSVRISAPGHYQVTSQDGSLDKSKNRDKSASPYLINVNKQHCSLDKSRNKKEKSALPFLINLVKVVASVLPQCFIQHRLHEVH